MMIDIGKPMNILLVPGTKFRVSWPEKPGIFELRTVVANNEKFLTLIDEFNCRRYYEWSSTTHKTIFGYNKFFSVSLTEIEEIEVQFDLVEG